MVVTIFRILFRRRISRLGGFDLSDPTYLKALKAFGRGEPTQTDIRSLESEMYSGPDRGAAVILGSMVERSLGHLLRINMRSQGVSDLFEFNGPLDSSRRTLERAEDSGVQAPTVFHDLDSLPLAPNRSLGRE